MSSLTTSDRAPLAATGSWSWSSVGWSIVGMLLFLRLWMLGNFPLYPDEAFYWLCSEKPSTSYWFGPPLFPWLLGIVRAVAGEELRVLRIVSLVAGIGTLYGVHSLALALYGNSRIALLAVVTFSLTPLHFIRGVLVDYDGFFVLFWVLALWFYFEAIRSESPRWLMAATAAFTLGLLSKYFMVLLPIGVLAFQDIAADQPNKRLRNRLLLSFLVGILAAGGLMLLGLMRNEIPLGGLTELLNGPRAHVGRSDTFKVLQEQLVLIGPVLFPWHLLLLVGAGRRYLAVKDRSALYCVCAALPVLVLFLGLSTRSHVSSEWLEVAFIPGSILLGAFLARLPRPETSASLRGLSYLLVGLAFVTNAFLIVTLPFPGLASALGVRAPLVQRFVAATSGWKELTQRVTELAGRSTKPLIVASPDFQVCSALEYLSSPRLKVYCVSDEDAGRQLRRWRGLDGLEGQEFLLIADQAQVKARYFEWIKQAFTSTAREPTVAIFRDGRPVRTFLIDRGIGFSGEAMPYP